MPDKTPKVPINGLEMNNQLFALQLTIKKRRRKLCSHSNLGGLPSRLLAYKRGLKLH